MPHASSPRRSVLLVAHLSPPSAMSAARRVAGLARYLPDAGVDVTLLTSIASGRGPVEGTAATIRTRDLLVSPLNWRRGNFRALAGESSGTYDASPSALASVIVPDLEVVGWTPFALARALALTGRGTFDCVVTSAPPFSGHLVGLALSARGLPWVADFRDAWRYEGGHRYPARWQRFLDEALERSVARRADAIVGVTAPITDDLVARYRAHGATITNGYDPRESRATTTDWTPPLRRDRHSLVYTGSLAYGGRPAGVVVDALRELRRGCPDLADRLELLVAGALSTDERDALQHPELDGAVQVLGSVPRDRALGLQREADSLLVMAGSGRSIATGKLYEYLATGRPVLVIGEQSVAADIVREQQAGRVVPADGGPALVQALADLVEGRVPAPAGDPSRFAYPALARRYADLIEQVVARRRARPAGR